MDVPTTKSLLEDIKAGIARVGLLPCPPDEIPVPGDTVRFQEATFEHFCAPSLVENGDSASVTLTSVYPTNNQYQGDTLCTLRWKREDNMLTRGLAQTTVSLDEEVQP
jgi:hypothetical protein